jgi:fibronectin-binding autotransporter adhesin
VSTGTIEYERGTIDGRVEMPEGRMASSGTGPGTLVVNGDLILGPDAVLSFKLGGTQPGTQHDQIVVHGHAVLDGTIEVSLLGTYTPDPDPDNPDRFRVLTFDSSAGVFDTCSIDIGGGLFLDAVPGVDDLTLVTRRG